MSPATASRRTIGNWEIQEVVGSGSFAIVWKARHLSTGTPAAVKEILADRLNRKLQESLESEIEVLQRLSHANIVGLLDLVKEPGRIYLVLEYCGGGDLAHHLRSRGPLSEASCRYLLRQLAEGLKVLRQHQIIHRDLKPQNLLLSDGGSSPTLKIADFGFARSLQPAGMAETLCGSPLYMAPEVLQLHRYDARADLWSVGTILFELLTGKPPFNGANHLQLIQNIERGEAALPDHLARSLSPGCRQLLSGLLRRNPTERLSFEDFFAHPFLQGEAASAAAGSATQPAGGGASGAGSGGSTGGSADCDSGSGGSGGGAAGAAQRPRCAPESHGAVRFVQPARYGGPIHPAFQVPSSQPASSSSSSSQQQQQPQQPPAPGAAAGSASPSSARAGGGAATSGGSAAAPSAATNAARSPSPRIVTAAAAVASMFMSRVGVGGGGGGDAASGRAAAQGTAAAVAAGGAGAVGSSGGPLADSLDEYVVISSPSTTPRTAAATAQAPPPPLVPRTPHPAMPGSGAPSRSASGGGALPSPSQAAALGGLSAATAAAAATSSAAAAAPAATAATAATTAAPQWQHMLAPIAAASLPHGPVPGSSPATGTGVGAVAGGGGGGGPATTMTIRLPGPGRDADADDPMLLPRAIGVVLEQARARCGAVLDAEEEERHLAAALGGGGFGASGMAAGGDAAAATAALAEEAAAAVGTLLAACRMLAAALSSHGAGSREATAAGDAAGTESATRTAAAAAGAGGICAAPPSRAAVAALAVQARSALAALDEHLHGAMARLLLSGDPAPSVLAPPTPSSSRPASGFNSPHQQQQQQQQPQAQQHGAGAPPGPPLVPACCDAVLGAAVRAARAGAGEEMLGHAAGAAEQYGRAADVLAFLLTTPQTPTSQGGAPEAEGGECGAEAHAGHPGEQLWDAVRPPLAPQDRQRLARYFAAVRLRQSAAAAAAGPTPTAGAATPFYHSQPYAYSYGDSYGHAPQPHLAQHDPLRQAPRSGLPHGHAPHGTGAVMY